MDIRIEETTEYEEILQYAFDNGVEYDEQNKRYVNAPYLGLKLLLDNKMIGTIAVCKSEYGDYIIEDLAVNENHRHKGYATMLIEYVIKKLKFERIKTIYLIAHVYDIYKKLGFDFTEENSYLIKNNCLNCDLYKSKECIPRVMKKELL